MSIAAELKNPSPKYRPVPFWSWNDKLDPKELRRQIDVMHEAGLGGGFMHARGGLLTEYMGEEWFECIRASIDEGRKFGMKIWAYDENGWPSGFGDGKVNGLGLKYQQKYIRLKKTVASEAEVCEHKIAVFTADGLSFAAPKSKEEEVLLCYFDVNPFYIDVLDKEVVKTFLDKIYQDYANRLDPKDWKDLAGFFTDEPQVSRNGIPWSFTYEEQYAKAYNGESLTSLLPQLLLEVGDYKRTRYRFWNLTTRLFMENFMKQIYDWCDAHGTQFTGHCVLEETYMSQITSNGAVMPQYMYLHIPGMDWLGRHIRPLTNPVQLLSVCAQTGRRQILSETFACCGWNVKFEHLKWMYQWQMIHGVNLLCQHLEGYSLKGIRKRDYPASLFHHQPWWGEYKAFNDYVSRLGVLLSEGEIKTDVLILHGESSAWLCFNNQRSEVIDLYWKSLDTLSERLNSAHVGYHYGDETVIDVLDGHLAKGSIVIGKQSYKLLVLPQMKNMSRKVWKLALDFANAGGKILGVRNTIEGSDFFIDGEPATDFAKLSSKIQWFDTEEELASAIKDHVAVVPVVTPGTSLEKLDSFDSQVPEIVSSRRHFAKLGASEAEVLYFVNINLEQGFESEIIVGGGSVERFDPSTGDFLPVLWRKLPDGRLAVPHFFSPAGDLVLVVRKSAAAASAGAVETSRRDPAQLASAEKALDLNGEYRVESMSDNLLTLDHCDSYFDGVLNERDGYVLSVQDKLLALKRPVDLRLEFKFSVDAGYDFSKPLYLVLEAPSHYSISINGAKTALADLGQLFDQAFRKLDIGPCVKPGANVIALETRFSQPEAVYKQIEASKVFESEKNKLSYTMEIEAVYLAGGFGVKTAGRFERLPREAMRCAGPFSLCAAPKTVVLDKLQECGLPFFAGRLVLAKDFKIERGQENGRFLVFDKQMAMVSKIRVNGKELKTFLWKPFSASLDGFLKAGDNRLEIELVNTLRNMLGPHHLQEGESYGVGPGSFNKDPGVFNWHPAPWNDGYCLVEFGIAGLKVL